MKRISTGLIGLALCLVCACAEPPPDTAATNSNTAQTNAAPVGPPTTPPSNRPPITPGGPIADPEKTGMRDIVNAYVVAYTCYRDRPASAPATLAECSKAAVAKGDLLILVGSDGTVYIDESNVSTTNYQLSTFIGQEVTAQGRFLEGEPDKKIPNREVKKMSIGPVRRLGSGAPGTAPASATQTNANSRPARQ